MCFTVNNPCISSTMNEFIQVKCEACLFTFAVILVVLRRVGGLGPGLGRGRAKKWPKPAGIYAGYL